MIKKKYIELDNGLTVVLSKNDKVHSFDARILIKYGFGNKDFTSNNVVYKCEDGLAHLLEHVLIDAGPNGNVFKYFTDNYYGFNGVTHKEFTEFFIHGYEDFEKNLGILIDVINNSTFTKEDVEKSKGPVLEEVRERSNVRNYEFNRTINYNLFNKDIALSGVGEFNSVKDFSYEDLRLVYDTFYKPSNEVITVSGNFDMDSILKVIKDSFKKIKREYITHEIIDFTDEETVRCKSSEVINEKDLELYDISFKVPLKEFRCDEIDRLHLYLDWYFDYNFSSKSELYKTIIDKGISSYAIGTSHYTSPYGNNFMIVSFLLPTSNGKEFVDLVLNELKNIKMPSDIKKDLYKKKLYFKRLLNLDSSSFLAREFALDYLFYNKTEFPSLEELDKVSFKEMEEFLNKLDFSNYTITHQKND